MIKIKNLLIALSLVLGTLTAAADDVVTFEFDRSDGIDPSVPVARMEKNVSGLLTAINKAATAKSPSIDFAGVEISDAAAYSLMQVWENVRMRTFDDDIIQKLLQLRGGRGYDVMNIGVEMMPLNPDEYTEPRNQEISITLDPQGRISDFVISMGLHQYSSMMKDAKTLEDIDQRQQILHFVEQFRTAYCEKDKQFLEDIFSNDALIITGRVRKRVGNEKRITEVVEYTMQSKKEYLTRLFKKFDNPKTYINVKFDDIEVEHSSQYPDFYGVTVRQEWNSTGYSDVGTVFLLWDFTKKDAPKIYVRTWQPLEDTNRFKIANFDF